MVLSIEVRGRKAREKLALMYGRPVTPSMQFDKVKPFYFNGLLFWYFDTF
jgi:hypothetical protein